MLNPNNFLTSFKTNNMKHTLFFSDYLNITGSVKPELLEKAVELSIDLQNNQGDYITNTLEFSKTMNEMVRTMDLVGIGFDDEKHQYKSVLSVVKIMADAYLGKQNYSIAQN